MGGPTVPPEQMADIYFRTVALAHQQDVEISAQSCVDICRCIFAGDISLELCFSRFQTLAERGIPEKTASRFLLPAVGDTATPLEEAIELFFDVQNSCSSDAVAGFAVYELLHMRKSHRDQVSFTASSCRANQGHSEDERQQFGAMSMLEADENDWNKLRLSPLAPPPLTPTRSRDVV